MANIDLERDQARREGDRDGDRDYRRRPSVKMVTSTETRRSFTTTEFWLAVVAAVALVVAGYVDDAAIDAQVAWSLAAGVVAAYLLSRGFAKSGSRDPVVRDFD